MQMTDRVYGSVTIDEPVLVNLMDSAPMLRLKGINNSGPMRYVFPERNVTRYEHSVGVMLLLRKLGASIEEQVAGLLHDVPHTAFSHAIDYVFPSDTHEFHEAFHERILLDSEIPLLLKKHGLDMDELLHGTFTLLERDLPDLCADRLDYAMRDAISIHGYDARIAGYANDLKVVDVEGRGKEIVFKDYASASSFGHHFLRMDDEMWAGSIDVAAHKLMADAMKRALDIGAITEKDFFLTDAEMYAKLSSCGDSVVVGTLHKIGPDLKVIEDASHYDIASKTKCRYVNPRFLLPDGSIARVGDSSPGFLEEIERHRASCRREYHIRIIS